MGIRTPIPLLASTYAKTNQKGGSTQKLVNFYMEAIPNTQGGGPTLACIGTPGLTSWLNLNGSQTRSLIEHQGTGFAVVDGNVYSINPSTVASTHLGNITTSTTGHISTAAINTDIVWADGSHVYDYNGSSFSDITATLSLGGTVNWVVAKDGFMIYMVNATNTIWVSNYEAVSTVNGNAYFTLSADYDAAVSACTSDYFIYFFGTRSTEIWYNAGNQIQPFARVTGGVLQVGNAAQFSAACIQENMYWLAQAPQGILGIAMANGPSYQIISTPDFVNKVSNYVSTSDAFATVSTHDGHMFYNLTFPNADVLVTGVNRGRTWMYDTSNGVLSERQSYNTSLSSQDRHVANCQMYLSGMQICGDFKSGNLYLESLNNYSDSGLDIENLVYSPSTQDRKCRLSLTNLQVDVECGQGLDGTGPSSPPIFCLQVSKDHGNSYGNKLIRYMPSLGNYRQRIRYGSVGSVYDFRFLITLSGAYKKVIYGMTAEPEREEQSYSRLVGLE